MIKTEPFEKHAVEYDSWFDKYPAVFESEADALRAAFPIGDLHGIEVGLGTGRMALALGIKEGVEPADAMREMAIERGIEVINATAEHLPYKDLHFDFVLMSSCISYIEELHLAFREANRVLKRGGTFIVGFIAKDSIIGKYYEEKRQKSVFLKQADFYSVEKVSSELKEAGFHYLEFFQTLFKSLDEIKEVEPAQKGYDKGSFIVIKAIKR